MIEQVKPWKYIIFYPEIFDFPLIMSPSIDLKSTDFLAPEEFDNTRIRTEALEYAAFMIKTQFLKSQGKDSLLSCMSVPDVAEFLKQSQFNRCGETETITINL